MAPKTFVMLIQQEEDIAGPKERIRVFEQELSLAAGSDLAADATETDLAAETVKAGPSPP